MHHSDSSILVAYVHQVFCQGLEASFKTAPVGMDRRNVEQIVQFKNKLLLWDYCHRVVDLKRQCDLDRSYLEIREGVIQKLIRLRKNQRDEIEELNSRLEKLCDGITGLDERRFHYAQELDRIKAQGLDAPKELQDGLEAKLNEIDEELVFRQNVLAVQMELAQAKVPHITQLEEELEHLELTRKKLELQAETMAKDLGLTKSLGKTLFFYMLNDGFFSYISESDWENMIFNCTSKEQTWLREHFAFIPSLNAWILNDEQHYYSPFKRKAIVGSRDSSGISLLDYNIKKLLDEKLVHLSFKRYQNEVRGFYASVCFSALEDGILTKEEAGMMSELAEVLHLESIQARQILNQEAIRVQKDFINENMALFYELAMSDGIMHREEAKFLVEMKNRLEGDLVDNVAQKIQKLEDDGLQLRMDDSEFFIQLCRLALKDNVLDIAEQQMLKTFVLRKGWPELRLSEILSSLK